MGKKGTIIRISLNNFGTYKNVEVYPGPNLNLLLGPNGSGKSTVVSAIILGLGGNPKVIGRASQISDYIKLNCTEANIQIELDSGDDDNENVIIERTFNKKNHTQWKLNGKLVIFKEISEVTSQMNIQISNLCQFLPQDRVQDFAKMNNQELLLNTQKSVGSNELVKYFDQLIIHRNEHKDLENNLSTLDSNLDYAQQQNNRIANLIQAIEQKRSLFLKLKQINGKVAWIEYDKKRSAAIEIKQDKETAEKQLEQYRNKLKPINNQITQIKDNISSLQENIIDQSRLVSNVSRNIQYQIETSERHFRSIKLASNELENKIKEEENRQANINEAKMKVNKLKTDLSTIEQNFGTVDVLENKMKDIQPQILNIDNQKDELNQEKNNIDYKLDNINYEIGQYNAEKRNIENIKNLRLDLLKKLSPHAYQSVLWLRKNKHLFKSNVYEPILLEINVKKSDDAKYIENIIPARDLCLFTCEETNDMNLLIKHLRIEQKLGVSVVHSGEQHPPYSAYRAPLPLDSIREYGFYAYADTLFTGPEAVMKYLCRNLRIHSIPIGTQLTNSVFKNIPSKINVFFSDNKRFSASVSKYTQEKSYRVIDIKSNGLLSLSLDVERLNLINNKISALNTKKQEIECSANKINQRMQNILNERNTLINQRREYHTNKSQIIQIQTRLNASIQQYEELKNCVFNVDAEKRKYKTKIQTEIDQLIDVQNVIVDQMKKYYSHSIEMRLKHCEKDVLNEKTLSLRQKYQQLTDKCTNLEQTLNDIQNQLTICRNEAKAQYNKAKNLTDGFTPNDEQFNKFNEIFDKLSDNFNELNEQIEDIQSKIECLKDLDDGALEEYETRQKLIESLTKQLTETKDQINTLEQDINELKLKWLQPLNELIQQIDSRFKYYFQRMGCEGSVSIVQADNEMDFEKYGLSIKVSYRSGVPLQELDQYVQSGGERAVATAIYMLALQHLTHVPFRCVDEINQGMDANNERKVFELIVDCTSEENTSQYFLLTPKLLPGLNYKKSIKVHTIHNGPWEILNHIYNVKKIVENISQHSRSFTESQTWSQ